MFCEKAILMHVDLRSQQLSKRLQDLSSIGIDASYFLMGQPNRDIYEVSEYHFKDDPFLPQPRNYYNAVQHLFKRELKAGTKSLLFIEDDIILYDDAREIFAAVERDLQGIDWDLVYFGTDRANVKCKRITENLIEVGPCYHLVCTAFSRRAMELVSQLKVNSTIDGAIYNHVIHQCKTYSAYPNPVAQDVATISCSTGKYPYGVENFRYSYGREE